MALQQRGDTDHVVKPMRQTAMFGADSSRFQASSPDAHLKAVRKQRMYARAERSRAAQQRIVDTYAREQRAKDEALRRRIASKSRQQLRYMVATLGVQPRTDAGYNPITEQVIA